jgi:hypothetical protein
MRITMSMAASKRPIDTEIGTLQFRKANPGWEVVNKNEGTIIGCNELQVLVDMMNDQIALERQWQALGFHNVPTNYARKVGQ